MLCSFDDIKDLVPNIEDKPKWQALMAVADEIIKTRSGNRVFTQGTHTDMISLKDGQELIYLREFPITAITKIEMDGEDINAILDTDYSYIYAPNTTDIIGIKLLLMTVGEMSITYTGGYSTIPAPIKLAFALVVAMSEYKIGQGIASSETLGSHPINYQNSTEIYKFIDSLLQPYWFKSYC